MFDRQSGVERVGEFGLVWSGDPRMLNDHI